MTNALIAFARAVGWGTLAGATPYMALLIIPMSLATLMAGYGSIGEIASLLAYPLMLSGSMVLGAALLCGLPLTALLSVMDRENSLAYAVTGLALGALVPPAIIWLLAGEVMFGESLFFAAPGAFAGLVTGTSWGRWREAPREAQDAL
ncbi:uncharacterized protein (DUF2062 family) [Erythromicrobium ramosum]|uniref:Uncharacterized protein (DUF2062 family) n=1 Tax=Erythrobacter ramosus TaxID=35811 RepID=A0A6I4UJR0_9SPHN|nr:hypothetical protein [Erythrobacter ramosus]MBB3774795.1 uncharacterized protein (DUF2062 family) [Erythrobacter ramosus]MXP37563.1 hypothetical protein [Erythrobacter ramosus]